MSELSPYLIQRTHAAAGLLPPPRTNSAVVAEGIGLDEIWRVIRRRLWLTVPLVMASLLITAIILFATTPKYTAQVRLLIQPDSPQVLNMTQLLEESTGSSDYDYYKTQFELLKSRALAAQVIRELALSQNELLSHNPPERDSLADLWNRAIQTILSVFQKPTVNRDNPQLEYSVDPGVIDMYVASLKVTPVFATQLVDVSFTLPDPVLAARIVDAHATDFVKSDIELRSSAQRAAQEFLKLQLVEISKRTEESEAALNAYRKRFGVLSFDVDENNRVAAQRMSDLTRALTNAETQRITAQSQVELIKHGDYESLPQVVNNATISALKPQLVALQAEYARLSAAFKLPYPKMVELKAQLTQDRQEISGIIANIARSVRRDYNAALTQQNQLREEIQAEKQKDLALNDALLKDAVLSREVQTNRDLYKNVLQRMQEMSVAAQTPLSNVRVVAGAEVPRSPSRPRKEIDLAIAAVASVLLGLVLSFVLEQVDKRLKTPEEIESYLNLATLAVVPDFTKITRARGGLGKQIRDRLTRVNPRISAARARRALSLLDSHKRGANEIYRTIRMSLMFSRSGSPPKTVLLTSSIEGEGKTWTVLHTAAAFAHTGAPTLLVSADLRRPRCDKLLNCEEGVGLSDALVGRRDPHEVIRRIHGQGFFFLAAGSHVPNPAELLASARMRQIIDLLASRYAFVLFDSAPVMHASDSLAIASMVDGVVIVVGARTPKKSVRSACDRLAMVDAKIIGAVLNGVDIRHPDYREYTNFYYRYDDEDEAGMEFTVV